MTDLDNLTEHLTKHFREHGGQFAAPYAETFANLAISGIGTFYPAGWTITGNGDRDGILDGAPRIDMLKMFRDSADVEPGAVSSVRYRGVDFATRVGFDGLIFETADSPWPLALYWNMTELDSALTALNVLDQWVDIIREQADRPAQEATS